jgi:hypothetical protein
MPQLPKLTKKADYVERRIHATLADERAKKDATHGGKLAFSQVGKCARLLYAGVNGVPEERDPQGRILVLFDLGEAVESHLISLLKRSGFEVQDRDPETGEQIRVVDFNGRASGRLDGEVLLGDRPHNQRWAVLELKSAKASRFDELEELDSYELWDLAYADQLQVYMGYRKRDEALVVVECKDDSRLHCERIAFNPTRFGELHQKARDIITAKTPPNRPPEAKSQYCGYCKWCDVNGWCWGPLAGVKFDE